MSAAARVVDHGSLIYKNEKPLFVFHVVLATIFWLAVIVGTLGIALLYLLFFFIGYLFAQSALISWLKGNGVRISAAQYPDLYVRYQHCCDTLGVTPYPDAYLINGSGLLNAFATRFLGRNFVVLFSNVVDAMADNPEALNFYIGHELGHIQRKHLKWAAYLWPASVLPLLGAAYSRAREYTCDQFGRACCTEPAIALQGLSALAAGEKRWATLSVPAYLEQAAETKGFWMSFHELVADYPWLVKRAARINDPDQAAPSRSFFAGVLALFVPRLGVGGGAGGLIVMVAIIGILAAIAIPAYQDYTARMHLTQAATMGKTAAAMVGSYYEAHQEIPADLKQAGFGAALPASVADITIDPENGVVTVTMAVAPVVGQSMAWTPSLDQNGKVTWKCASEDIQGKLLPKECRPS
jgi:Zn-dependent protease with chaperone function/Tfp pilus assembly protein PilE